MQVSIGKANVKKQPIDGSTQLAHELFIFTIMLHICDP